MVLDVTLSYKVRHGYLDDDEYGNPYLDDIFYTVRVPAKEVDSPEEYITVLGDYISDQVILDLSEVGYSGASHNEIQDRLFDLYDDERMVLG